MEINNARTGSPQGKGSQRSQSESEPPIVGTFSGSSVEHGSYEIRASGEDRDKSNNVVTVQQSSEGIAGKIVRQLVEETDKQLAYHKEQVKALEERRKELKQFSEEYVNEEPE